MCGTARPYCARARPARPEARLSRSLLPLPALLPLLALVPGCWAPEVAPPGDGPAGGGAEAPLVFVQGGVVAPADVGAEGRRLAEDRVLVDQPWQPGEAVEVVGHLRRVRQEAPDHASCLALFHLGLGSRTPTSVHFDAMGDRLRVERQGADTLVVDAWTGQPASAEGFLAAPERPAPVPAGCPVEQPQEPARVAPDGLRHAVVEGPLVERGGETGWRVVVLR